MESPYNKLSKATKQSLSAASTVQSTKLILENKTIVLDGTEYTLMTFELGTNSFASQRGHRHLKVQLSDEGSAIEE